LGHQSGGRWWVADRLQKLLRWAESDGYPTLSLSMCGRALVGGVADIHRTKGGRAWVGGVMTCGSARCPVCAGRVARQRAEYLGRVQEAASALGLRIGMVTLTVSHGRKDLLADLRKDLTTALARARSGAPWKRLMASSGMAGSLRWWEATWGEVSGWHLHAHAWVFVHRDGDLGAACRGLIDRWRRMAGDAGRVTSQSGQDWREVTTAGRDDDRSKEYATGDTVLGLSLEVASAWTKEGRRPGRMGLGEIASLAAVGDKTCQTKYLELVEALRGLRGLTIDRGLSRLLDVGPDPEEDEEENGEDGSGDESGSDGDGQTLGTVQVPATAWAALVRRRRRGEAVAAVADATASRDGLTAAAAAVGGLAGEQAAMPPVRMADDKPSAADAAVPPGAPAPASPDRGGGAAARLAYDPETGEVLPVIAAG